MQGAQAGLELSGAGGTWEAGTETGLGCLLLRVEITQWREE